MTEITHKLKLVREALQATAATALRLRGTDWFSWLTAGASPTVLLAAETGIAELFITPDQAYVLTDEIEAQRLIDEELSEDFTPWVYPWAQTEQREAWVREVSGGGLILSDRPTRDENPLPPDLIEEKRRLQPEEIHRYREVGRLASLAMTEVLAVARPTWTEYQLAGAGAEALWAKGLHPALTLAAGARRLPLYRHPTPTHEPLGQRAMLVFCARGRGLYASLTRFVNFTPFSAAEAQRDQALRDIEATVLASLPGTSLATVYHQLHQAYAQAGYPHAM